jgi:hypothetical protein
MVNEAIVPALDAIPAPSDANVPNASTRAELDRRRVDLTRTLERHLMAISLDQ